MYISEPLSISPVDAMESVKAAVDTGPPFLADILAHRVKVISTHLVAFPGQPEQENPHRLQDDGQHAQNQEHAGDFIQDGRLVKVPESFKKNNNIGHDWFILPFGLYA